jgi:hypothetical protein
MKNLYYQKLIFQMSPVYKELLLKLVMSMSRDELFIRSKNIMDQEKMKSGGLKSNSNLDALALLQQTANAATATAPPTVTKSSGFGSLLGFRKPFLGRKTTKQTETETKNSKNKKTSLGLSVGSKATFTSSGSVASRRKNSSKRRRGGKAVANVDNVKNLVAAANNNNNNESNAKSNNNAAVAAKSAKKKFSKSDISQPIPVFNLRHFLLFSTVL